jgi:tRNA(fMet)-specific endonuclease VapC
MLDTVAAIGFLNGDPRLLNSLTGTEQIAVPIIVLGELFAGAEQSSKRESNLRRVEDFASRRHILFCDIQTAQMYGRVIAQLRRKGRPIPQNDAWIAALALQHRMTLLTIDTHF